MVKVIKLGTWKTSRLGNAFLEHLIFAYLGQNKITHYQSSAFFHVRVSFNFFQLECGQSLTVNSLSSVNVLAFSISALT